MNKPSFLHLTLALALLSNVTLADDLFKMPPNPSAWTVNITYPDSSSSPTTSPAAKPTQTGIDLIQKIEIEQDGAKTRSVLYWASGKTIERWTLAGMLLSEDDHGQVYMLRSDLVGQAVFHVPFTLPTSLDWIKPELQQGKGTVSYNGTDCYYYKGAVAMFSVDPMHHMPPTKVQAWIDSKTDLPVAIDDGAGLGTFTFSKMPPPPLVLPAKFQKAIEDYEKYSGPLPGAH